MLSCEPEYCSELEDMMELDGNANTGVAILRRAVNKTIDREETKYYGIETDLLLYTLSVSDGKHTSYAEVSGILQFSHFS